MLETEGTIQGNEGRRQRAIAGNRKSPENS